MDLVFIQVDFCNNFFLDFYCQNIVVFLHTFWSILVSHELNQELWSFVLFFLINLLYLALAVFKLRIMWDLIQQVPNAVTNDICNMRASPSNNDVVLIRLMNPYHVSYHDNIVLNDSLFNDLLDDIIHCLYIRNKFKESLLVQRQYVIHNQVLVLFNFLDLKLTFIVNQYSSLFFIHRQACKLCL